MKGYRLRCDWPKAGHHCGGVVDCVRTALDACLN